MSKKSRNHSTPQSPGSIIYEYQLANRKPAIRVIRTPSKDFYQQRLNDSGFWVDRLGGVKPPLYRLPELFTADPEKAVFLLEGEKDVDRAVKEGLVATTNSQGAMAFKSYMVSWLAGRDVVVVADNDEEGLKGAIRKAEMLKPHIQSLKVIECLPGIEDIVGGDLSDWFDAGHTASDLRGLAESLPEWRPSVSPSNFKLTKMSDFLVQPDNEVDWLVDGIMAIGGTSTVYAKPKVGKSTMARNLSLAVARGSDFLRRRVEQGPVIYLALEETERRVRQQFRRMGATGNEPIHVYAGPTPAKLFEEILPYMESIQPKLLVLDPLFRAVHIRDGNSYAEVTNALTPILRLAADTGCHVCALHHAGKAAREAVDAALGSTAITGSFDSLIKLETKPDGRTIEMVLREGHPLPRTVLSIDPETELISLGGTVEEHEFARIAEEILDVTGDSWLTEAEITEAVTGKTIHIRKELRAVFAAGKLAREGKGKSGSPYVYSEVSFSRSHYRAGTREQDISELETPETTKPAGETREQDILPFTEPDSSVVADGSLRI